MSKKDFSNVSTGSVYNTIAAATSEADQVQTTQETQPAKRGRKPRTTHDISNNASNTQSNEKLLRINMAFDNDVASYIRTMARVSGLTMTDFCNVALRQHMKDHEQLYQKAIEFRNSL